jgi:hypothetical protein
MGAGKYPYMTDQDKKPEELEEQDGELLPDRALMSVVRTPEDAVLFPDPDPPTYEVSPEDPPQT